MIHACYLYDTCYFYIEPEDTFYKKKNQTNDQIVLEKCPNDEINPIVHLIKPQKEIVKTIKHYLEEIYRVVDKPSKIQICTELFEFILKYVGFLNIHEKFKTVVEKKLRMFAMEKDFQAAKYYYQKIFHKPLKTHASLYQVTDTLGDLEYVSKKVKKVTSINQDINQDINHPINPFTSTIEPGILIERCIYTNTVSQPFNVFKHGCPNNCQYCPLHYPLDYLYYDGPYLKVPNWKHRPRWFQAEDMILSCREIDILLDKNSLASNYWSKNSEIVFNYIDLVNYQKSHPNSKYEATAIFHTQKKSWSGIRKIIYS
jgi:hypothetical protein